MLAQVFGLQREHTQATGQLAGALPGTGCMPSAAQASGYVGNAPGLAALAGHITPRLDPDGSVRRVPAIVCFDGRNYPALSLAGLLALDPSSAAAPLRIEPGRGEFDSPWALTLTGMPQVRVPLDADGDMRVPYHKARSSIVSVSAADVIEGKLARKDVLRGAWVLVGASAFGLGDTVPTALGGAVSGVEVHAQLLTGMLDGAVPFTPRIGGMLAFAWAALAIVLLLALTGLRPASVAKRPSVRVLWRSAGGLRDRCGDVRPACARFARRRLVARLVACGARHRARRRLHRPGRTRAKPGRTRPAVHQPRQLPACLGGREGRAGRAERRDPGRAPRRDDRGGRRAQLLRVSRSARSGRCGARAASLLFHRQRHRRAGRRHRRRDGGRHADRGVQRFASDAMRIRWPA